MKNIMRGMLGCLLSIVLLAASGCGMGASVKETETTTTAATEIDLVIPDVEVCTFDHVRFDGECHTDEQLEELRETVELQEFYVSKQDPDRIKTMDSKFHQLIYRFCGSSVLYDTLMPLHKKVQKYRRASVENNARVQQSAREHRAIFEAIEAGNAELAEKYTVEHIANATKHILNKEV